MVCLAVLLDQIWYLELRIFHTYYKLIIILGASSHLHTLKYALTRSVNLLSFIDIECVFCQELNVNFLCLLTLLIFNQDLLECR